MLPATQRYGYLLIKFFREPILSMEKLAQRESTNLQKNMMNEPRNSMMKHLKNSKLMS
jgi:hypothetical protein